MEPILTPETPNLSSSLQFDNHLRSQVSETARWAKFLSIMGFMVSGLLVVLAIFINSIMSLLPNQENNPINNFRFLLPIIYFAIAIVYFFPCMHLFRFASKAKSAVNTNSQADLNISFTQLKRFFKFIGIMTIVILCIYALILIIVLGFVMMLRH